MTVPGADINAVEAALVNLIIDEAVDSPYVASVTQTVEEKAFMVQPRNYAHPIGKFVTGELPKGQIVFEQAGGTLKRFLLELASTGESAKASFGGIKPTHTLRLNDPADTNNDHDVLFLKVYLFNFREDYPEGETQKKKYVIDWEAYPVTDGGADEGNVYVVGRALPA